MTEILRNLSVLEGLSDELLERLASEVTEVEVRAGDWMIREGEAADRMFIVRSGRVEVIDEGPPEVLIRVFRRGEVVGELALLHTGIRSASVRARRDTQLGASLAVSIERPRLRRRLLEAVVQAAAGVFEASSSSIALADPAERHLTYVAAWGAGASEVVGIRLARGEGVAGAVAESGQAQIVPNCRTDSRFRSPAGEQHRVRASHVARASAATRSLECFRCSTAAAATRSAPTKCSVRSCSPR